MSHFARFAQFANFARVVYTIFLVALLPFLLPYLAVRRRLDAATFGFVKPIKTSRPVLWLHAVSVGEAAAADALIFALRQHYECVLTYTTEAGGVWLRRRHGDYAHISRLPLDLPSAAARFMARTNPTLAIMMEAEYWPNILYAAKAAGATLVLANGRLSRNSARRFARFSPLMRGMASCFDVAAMQTHADARRFRLFGAPAQTVGNLKFDRPINAALSAAGIQWRAEWNRHADNKTRQVVLIAGSRAGEESLLLAAMQKNNFYARFYPVFAPRHRERGDEVAALLSAQKITFARRSSQVTIDDSRRLQQSDNVGDSHQTDNGYNSQQGDNTLPRSSDMAYLADTLGEMDAWYAFCDVAIICGSFCPYGGQNPIEAMSCGAVAVIGPHSENYRAVVGQAVRDGALLVAADAADAIRQLHEITTQPKIMQQQVTAAQKFCEQQQGALAAHLKIIDEVVALRSD